MTYFKLKLTNMEICPKCKIHKQVCQALKLHKKPAR